MTLNVFHFAGVAEVAVTRGLPRLIEIFDARKEPSTPKLTVYLEKEEIIKRVESKQTMARRFLRVWRFYGNKNLSPLRADFRGLSNGKYIAGDCQAFLFNRKAG